MSGQEGVRCWIGWRYRRRREWGGIPKRNLMERLEVPSGHLETGHGHDACSEGWMGRGKCCGKISGQQKEGSNRTTT